MPIAVLRYDEHWPRRFEEERADLERTLAPWMTSGVHHIGSTAVPGLSAKPIIDIMAGISALREARAAIPALAGLGYRHAPHRAEALWFHKPDSAQLSAREYHLHLTEPGSALWRERLTFRDALRADEVLRDEYEALKLRLAEAHGEDIKAYTADKRAFVERVLALHGVTLA